MMDLSYTQHKAAYDHRIGIDNLMFARPISAPIGPAPAKEAG